MVAMWVATRPATTAVAILCLVAIALIDCDLYRSTLSVLEFLEDRASERKMRLFGAACCRRVWHLLYRRRWRTGPSPSSS